MDDIDDKAGLEIEDLEDLEDLEERGRASSPGRVQSGACEEETTRSRRLDLDASEPSRTPFGADFFVSAKREPDARLPLTLTRHESDQSITSDTGSAPMIEILSHRAFLEQQLGDFVHQACAKRSRSVDDARHEASRHGDGRLGFNLNAADFQPRCAGRIRGNQIPDVRAARDA